MGDDIETAKRNNVTGAVYGQRGVSRDTGSNGCGIFITILSYLIFILTFPITIFCSIKVVNEYERAVVFRLGRLVSGLKGPGTFFIMPFTDTFIKVDLRLKSYNVPPQE
ncbi:unnamed protein product [Caenorhabditis auriculariae]|uniref:Band 7 domain-containing protein n=1 Tax=Caenorhabditis auriculariae TaxID=2777116 RepID=A0A8S1HHU9_9PELO|nr:unnamed protein product [Caenorhabditis auriculariae]